MCCEKSTIVLYFPSPPDNLWINMFSYHDTFEILDGGGG